MILLRFCFVWLVGLGAWGALNKAEREADETRTCHWYSSFLTMRPVGSMSRVTSLKKSTPETVLEGPVSLMSSSTRSNLSPFSMSLASVLDASPKIHSTRGSALGDPGKCAFSPWK